MKAIVQDKYGSPDVLQLKDIDKPVVNDDEVLVRVHSTSCRHLRAGTPTGACFPHHHGSRRAL